MFTTPAFDLGEVARRGRLRGPRPLAQPRARAARDPRRSSGGHAGARRSRRPVRARSVPCSRSPATPCSRRRTASASQPPWARSTSWCRSTSTSTRPPVTPTSSCRRAGGWPRITSICSSPPSRCATSPVGRHRWSSRRRASAPTGRSCSRSPSGSAADRMGEPWLDAVLRLVRPLGLRWTPTGFADLLLRFGPYGDRLLPWSRGLNMKKLSAAPHGIDLGSLAPGVERRIYHRDKRIHLTPPAIMAAMDGLARDLDRGSAAAEARADRAPRAAQQQFVDAQRAGARRGARALRALRSSRRRRALRRRRRRDGDA